MDTKKLRQKILDLAIRGKLVPQDPNDEPASVLLERIRAEKEQLIKEGKIKRSKKSAATDKSHYENVPFEIPENWCWTTLGEVFTLQAGKNITAKEISDKEDTIYPFPCYGGNGLRGYVSSYNRTGRFPLIGRQGALCGNINVADGLFYATEHAVVVESYCNIDVDWAVYALIYLNLNQYATSTAQPGLSVATINEVLLPVPPIDEQRRIANEIEKWFDLIKEIESGKVELKSYIKQTKSKILDLAISGKLVPQDPEAEPSIELLKRINPDFEPCDNSHYENLPFEVPDGWCWAKINDVTEFIKNGAQIKQFKGASGIPITRIETISNSELDMARMGYANITNGAEYKDYYIKDGDILMSHINSRAHIGKCALCNVGENQIIHGMNLLRIRCSKQILPEYMVYYFRSTTFYNLIEPHIKNAVNQASINITNLQKILIPIPPYSEQRRVAFIVDKLFSTIDTITAEL